MAPKLETVDTRARTKLNNWMRNRTQSGLARILGVAQPAVRAWLVGSNRPTEPYRRALEKLAGIPASDWFTDDERAFLERMSEVTHV